MKLESPDGNLFTLKVEGYEFPDEELGPHEDNPADDFDTDRFLIVSHKFRDASGEWQACGPTMKTSELQRLKDWLITVRDGNVELDGVYFTERELELSIDKSRSILRVHLCYDFVRDRTGPEETVVIEFPIQSLNMRSIVESLNQQLARFPGRPPIENTE